MQNYSNSPFMQHVARVLPGGVGDGEAIPPGYGKYGYRRLNPAPFGAALVAVRPIPAVGVQAGDVVFYASGSSPLTKSERRSVRAHIERIPRALFGAVLDHADALELAVASGSFGAEDWQGRLRANWQQYCRLRRKWSDATSPLWILRPWGTVAEAVEAADDEGAISALLLSVGGR